MARANVNNTTAPVHKVPNGVLTPDAELTAHLEKDPAIGMAWTKELMKLQIPNATISWSASMGLPPAGKKQMEERPQLSPIAQVHYLLLSAKLGN